MLVFPTQDTSFAMRKPSFTMKISCFMKETSHERHTNLIYVHTKNTQAKNREKKD